MNRLKLILVTSAALVVIFGFFYLRSDSRPTTALDRPLGVNDVSASTSSASQSEVPENGRVSVTSKQAAEEGTDHVPGRGPGSDDAARVPLQGLQSVYRSAMRGPNLPPPVDSILRALNAEDSAGNHTVVEECLAPWRSDLDTAWRSAKELQSRVVREKIDEGEFIEIDEADFDSSPYESLMYTPVVHYGMRNSAKLVVLRPGDSPDFDAAVEQYGVVLSAALASIEQVSYQLTMSHQ